MSARHQARSIMEAVALLHEGGFGLLKLHCYVKDGLGAWRHTLFAAADFPASLRGLTPDPATGSLPDFPLAEGETPQQIATAIGLQFAELLEAARGTDALYVPWYRGLLERFPNEILCMEHASTARMGSVVIPTPYAR